MKVAVCVKSSASIADDEFELEGERGAVPGEDLDYGLSDWDACAVEEALRIREAGDGEVVVISAGGEEAEVALRRCLAMGADRAVRVDLDDQDPFAIAAGLAGAVGADPDLVLCGAQSADSAQGAVGTALAANLGLPVAAIAKRIALGDGGAVELDAELEGGAIDVLAAQLPLVVTVQTGINEPRYVNLRAIKRAEAEPIEVVGAAAASRPAAVLRRLFVPESAAAAENIGGDGATVAARIAAIVEAGRR